jgi:hypothetical protein
MGGPEGHLKYGGEVKNQDKSGKADTNNKTVLQTYTILCDIINRGPLQKYGRCSNKNKAL